MVLELCPTSNLHTHAVEGIKEFEHIVRTFWDRGVKITFNTDGPYLLDTDMRREIELVETNRILTPEQVDQTLAWARRVLVHSRAAEHVPARCDRCCSALARRPPTTLGLLGAAAARDARRRWPAALRRRARRRAAGPGR